MTGKRPSAREVVHDALGCNGAKRMHFLDGSMTPVFEHTAACDRLTSALEAREAEHVEAMAAKEREFVEMRGRYVDQARRGDRLDREREDAIAERDRADAEWRASFAREGQASLRADRAEARERIMREALKAIGFDVRGEVTWCGACGDLVDVCDEYIERGGNCEGWEARRALAEVDRLRGAGECAGSGTVGGLGGLRYCHDCKGTGRVPPTEEQNGSVCGARNRGGRFCDEPAGHTHLHAYRLDSDPLAPATPEQAAIAKNWKAQCECGAPSCRVCPPPTEETKP